MSAGAETRALSFAGRLSESIAINATGDEARFIRVRLVHDGRPFTAADGVCFVTGAFGLNGDGFTFGAELPKTTANGP